MVLVLVGLVLSELVVAVVVGLELVLLVRLVLLA
jgi:hypothetical protein